MHTFLTGDSLGSSPKSLRSKVLSGLIACTNIILDMGVGHSLRDILNNSHLV